MRPLPACHHAEYHVEPNGRVVVRTLRDGVILDQRRFRDMKAANKAVSKDLYCGKRGAMFLPRGPKNRSMDLFWAQSRLNGLGRVAPRKRARKARATRSCGCGG